MNATVFCRRNGAAFYTLLYILISLATTNFHEKHNMFDCPKLYVQINYLISYLGSLLSLEPKYWHYVKSMSHLHCISEYSKLLQVRSQPFIFWQNDHLSTSCMHLHSNVTKYNEKVRISLILIDFNKFKFCPWFSLLPGGKEWKPAPCKLSDMLMIFLGWRQSINDG